MPDTVILRFRDLGISDAVAEHRRVISLAGYVWWGWWKKDSEPDQLRNIEELRTHAARGSLVIGLFNRATGRFYVADVDACIGSSSPVGSPDRLRTPRYYEDIRLPAWFKLTSIDEIDELTFVRHFKAVPLGEGTFFPIWFDRPTSQTFAQDTIKLRNGCVLHLSDIHLGTDFGFSSNPGPGSVPLLDVLGRDLEANPPGLVIISGDITTRADANVLLNEGLPFLRKLANRLNLPPERVIIIPGNHDIPLSKFTPHDYAHETAFKTFLKEFYGRHIQYPELKRFEFPNGRKLEVLGINSVRLRHESEKNFGYVEWQLYDDVLNVTPHDPDVFRMAVLHHHLVSAPREEVPDPHYPEASVSTTLDAGAVIAGLQRHGFSLALHGHQHVPAATRVAKGRLGDNSTMLEGLDTGLTVVAAGSAGADAHRLSHEMRDNAYNLINFNDTGVEIEARRYTKSSAPRPYFRFSL